VNDFQNVYPVIEFIVYLVKMTQANRQWSFDSCLHCCKWHQQPLNVCVQS